MINVHVAEDQFNPTSHIILAQFTNCHFKTDQKQQNNVYDPLVLKFCQHVCNASMFSPLNTVHLLASYNKSTWQ